MHLKMFVFMIIYINWLLTNFTFAILHQKNTKKNGFIGFTNCRNRDIFNNFENIKKLTPKYLKKCMTSNNINTLAENFPDVHFEDCCRPESFALACRDFKKDICKRRGKKIHHKNCSFVFKGKFSNECIERKKTLAKEDSDKKRLLGLF